MPYATSAGVLPACDAALQVRELLNDVGELNYNKLNWGDDEARRLAIVLPMCVSLRVLHLTGNGRIGDEGMAALAHACGAGAAPKLAELRLGGNSIGDDGLRALCDAVGGNGALPVLEQLHLNINLIGDSGLRSLAHAAADSNAAFAQLRTLNLQHNPRISEEGVDALSSMLAAGGLVSLRQVSLPPQLCAIPQLTTACGARGILLQP